MTIKLHLFGQLRHLADAETLDLDIADGTPLMRVLSDTARAQGDEFAGILLDGDGVRPSMMVLLNDDPIDKANPPALQDGDAITLLSAIAGG